MVQGGRTRIARPAWDLFHKLEGRRAGSEFSQIQGENHMNIDLLVIILFIISCGAVYKAFAAKDAQQKKLYGFIALFLGGVLFVLRNYVSK
jgi:hypothetical protein